MAQELGRISRPTSAQYEGRRKLLLVPLIYGPPADAPEGVAVLQKYWDQMQLQVQSLASALGGMHHIYHESIFEGGENGLEQLEKADQRSHQFVKTKCQSGASLEATEDAGILMETLDLQRCLMMPMASETVALKLHEWFTESNKKRYDHIASVIDTTLGENQVGLILVSERHQIQFPDDIEVFYVSPPALDEFRRWVQNWAAQQQRPPEAAQAEADEGEPAAEAQPVNEGEQEVTEEPLVDVEPVVEEGPQAEE